MKLYTQTRNLLAPLLRGLFQDKNKAWLFPFILTLLLVIGTTLKLNGSSMGSYHRMLYGVESKDPALLLNKPRDIRSDEWAVNTQMTIAQFNNGYQRINKNIGNGEDMSLIVDVPYKEWSIIFKPQNLSFFVLPFDFAYAFKWWFMSYALVLSAYCFALAILPKRYLLASVLSLTMLAAPFVQWWYQYITLGPIYYALGVGALVVHLTRAVNTSRRKAILYILSISYLLTCMALVLYPPFQIACALPLLALAVGLLLNKRRDTSIFGPLVILISSAFIALTITIVFILTRWGVVHTISSTAYPGHRLETSGGYSILHTFTGYLDVNLQSGIKASRYAIPANGLTNQSEDSNFILTLPVIITPLALLLYAQFRKRNIDWSIVTLLLLLLSLLAWLFVPEVPIIGKLLQLDRVPHNRLIIGLGVLNFMLTTILFKHLLEKRSAFFKMKITLVYSLFCYFALVACGLLVLKTQPGYIGHYRVIVFSLPIAIFVFFTLQKRILLASAALLSIGLLATIRIHPIYKGTAILSENKLVVAIKDIASTNDSRWATEDGNVQNFAYMSGARSVSGVFFYPQLALWQGASNSFQKDIYNRYAHTNFTFDRNIDVQEPTKLTLTSPDHFGITTEPCSPFLQNLHVRFLLTSVPLAESESCTTLIREVDYPRARFYIYDISK